MSGERLTIKARGGHGDDSRVYTAQLRTRTVPLVGDRLVLPALGELAPFTVIARELDLWQEPIVWIDVHGLEEYEQTALFRNLGATSESAAAPAPITPGDLYEWRRYWQRWHGTPEELASIAREAIRQVGSRAVQVPSTMLTVGSRDAAFSVESPELLARETQIAMKHGPSADILVQLLPAEKASIPWVRALWEGEGLPTKRWQRPRGTSWSTFGPPMLVYLSFKHNGPGAELRVLAASGLAGESIFQRLGRAVDLGARPRAWRPSDAAALGAASASAVAIAAIAEFPLSGGLGGLVVVGSLLLGGAAAHRFATWAFPPLELHYLGSQARIERAGRALWQFLLFALALAGVILALVIGGGPS